jgi:hypothetical protein
MPGRGAGVESIRSKNIRSLSGLMLAGNPARQPRAPHHSEARPQEAAVDHGDQMQP